MELYFFSKTRVPIVIKKITRQITSCTNFWLMWITILQMIWNFYLIKSEFQQTKMLQIEMLICSFLI